MQEGEISKLIINVDVFSLGKIGDGSLVYQTEKAPKTEFYFNLSTLKEVQKLISKESGGNLKWLTGKLNDAIEFSE